MMDYLKHHRIRIGLLLIFTAALAAACTPRLFTEVTHTAQGLPASLDDPAPIPTAAFTATALQATPSPAPSETPILKSTPPLTATRSQDVTGERLKLAARQYLADTPAQAAAVARRIHYLDGRTESEENMCGALSAALLIDAGILTPDVAPHDLWLLNARDAQPGGGIQTLQREVFPPQLFDYFSVEQSVAEFDWSAFPLQVGDWLYLFTGPNGFDHMLVVTEVESGVPYTVTNWERQDVGFQIIRAPLYDLDHPGEGLFFEMTDPSRGMLGVSGGKGFLLIRKKEGIPSPLPLADLQAELDPRAAWSGLLLDADGKILFASRPYGVFHPASMIKLPLSMIFLDTLEKAGFTAQDLAVRGYQGATFQQLIERTLIQSEEPAAATMIEYLSVNRVNALAVLESWGLADTSFSPRRSTAFDLVRSLQLLFQGEVLSDWSRSLILESLAAYTPNDDTLLGKLKSVLPDAQWLDKRGTLVSPLIIADMGILVIDGRPFYILLQASPKVDQTITYEEIQASLESFAGAAAGRLAAYARRK